jgi:hypothetical protein
MWIKILHTLLIYYIFDHFYLFQLYYFNCSYFGCTKVQFVGNHHRTSQVQVYNLNKYSTLICTYLGGGWSTT